MNEIPKSFIESKIVNMILLILLLLTFVLSVRHSFVSFIPHLNSDIAATNMVYPQIIEKYGLFFNGWIGSEDVIMSRPAIITVLAHLLTKDWIVSAIITVCVMRIITLLLIFCLLRQLKFSYTSTLISLIFLLCAVFPINEGNIINGGMGTDYSVLGILFLSINILRNCLHYGEQVKHRALYYTLYCMAIFLCGFFGFKLIAIIILPIFLIDIYEIVNKAEKENDFICLLKQCFSHFYTLMVASIGFLSSKIYNSISHEWSYASIRLGSFENILDGLKNHTKMFIGSLGLPISGLNISSIYDLLKFAEFGLRLMLLISLFLFTLYFLKNLSKQIAILNSALYFSLVFTTNFIFFVIFFYNYHASRQHFFVWFFVAVVIAFVVDEFGKTNVLLRTFSIICVVMLCFISLYNNNLKNYSSLANSNTTYQSIADYLVEEGYDGVYATHWNSAVIAGCSNLKLSCGSFLNGGFVPREWLVDSRAFEKTDGKWAVLLTDSELIAFEENAVLSDKEKLSKMSLVKRIEAAHTAEGVQNINIYQSKFNPTFNQGE